MKKNSLLFNYMQQRIRSDREIIESKDPGPVITISREYGCPARKIAEKLSELLTIKNLTKGKDVKWRWIDKQIL